MKKETWLMWSGEGERGTKKIVETTERGVIKNGMMLSEETKQVLKEVLIEIEHIRNRSNEKNDYPPSDYPYRPCQAIIAERLGFNNRADWHTDEFLGFEAKL